MRARELYFFLLLLIAVIVNGSCQSNDLKNQLENFSGSKIVFPYDKLDFRVCSFYTDTTELSDRYSFVNYISSVGCTSCEISRIGRMEKTIPLEMKREIDIIYIVQVEKEKSDWVYNELCNARIDGKVYIDTCNAFINANPLLPSSKLFHSFVLDGEKNVKLVGNPFENTKLYELLEQILKQ